MDRNRYRVQRFEFADKSTEVGKAGNTFTFEFLLPTNRLDNLAHYLRQPPQRMCFVQRDRVSWRRQEVAALTDESFQTKFNGLPVEQDDRARIPCLFGVRFQVQSGDERFGGFVERPGVKADFDVAAVVPMAVAGFQSWSWLQGWTIPWLLHSKTP